LIVDSKFVLIGGNAAEYRVKAIVDDEEVIISAHVDEEGTVVSDRIPIVETGISGVRKMADGHTTHAMADGEFYILEIFDTTGALTTTARMVSKRSTILNDLLSSSNPITEFTAEASQINGSDWVLYVGQNPQDLSIWPRVTYADGYSEIVPIDSLSTFIYGMEDVVTTASGVQFQVIIKHFLAEDVPSAIAEGEGVRFVSLTKTIRIIPREYADFSKISVVPWYDADNSIWELTFFGYYTSRERFELLAPSAVRFVGTEFDGTSLGVQQELTIHADIMNEFGVLETYAQTFAIKVDEPDSIVPFLIAPDASSEFVYGAEDADHNRPTLNFDVLRGTYFIPTSAFVDEEEFLDNFYTQAVPPFLAGVESEAPTPTHFTIRDRTNGRILVAVPVAVATYDQEMTFIVTGGDPAQYNDSTVVIEFLLEQSGVFSILYGCPVSVVEGTYNV
jgi:hypothetical protein